MILNIDKVSAGYGRVNVLRGVSVNVGVGEIVLLIGANGAGKSTLLRVVSGIIRPSEGQVEFEGENMTSRDPSYIVKAGLCHVPEGRQIFGSMTVKQNLMLGSYPKKCKKDDFERLLDSVFELFPVLKNRILQKASTLSGGEQQMLAIGRALMSQPKLLLLDEPSMGLAPLMVESILKAISELRQSGMSVLLVEQNVMGSLEISDRAYIIETGKIFAEGTGEELRGNDSIRKSYLGI